MSAPPPMTPEKAAGCQDPAVPRPAPQVVMPLPTLRSAMLAHSHKQVREVLMEDPDSARLPFFDHETEPPLCCALKQKCSAEIVKLLLEHGADPEMTDRQNQTPADILKSMCAAGTNYTNYEGIDSIEHMLGVCPSGPPELRQQGPLPDYTEDYAMLSQAFLTDMALLNALPLPPWALMGFQVLSHPPPTLNHVDFQLAGF